MNKLTEIKQHMDTCCIEEYERLYFLISLLEEKEKALKEIADTKKDRSGVYCRVIARKALNTSSNSEGE